MLLTKFYFISESLTKNFAESCVVENPSETSAKSLPSTVPLEECITFLLLTTSHQFNVTNVPVRKDIFSST